MKNDSKAIRVIKIPKDDLIRDECAATLLLLCNMVCRILNIKPSINQDEMFTRIADYVNNHTKERRYEIQKFAEAKENAAQEGSDSPDGLFLREDWPTFIQRDEEPIDSIED